MTRIDVGFILRLAVLHALALLALALPAHAEWEDYQYETFDSTETIFPAGTFGEATYSVDNAGRYIVNGMDSSVDSLAAINDSNSFYRVSADCQILSSTAGELAFCGLIFHYGKRPGDDKVSYYVFYVYGDGFYGVKRIMNGGKSDVVIPLANTELLTAGESNTLAVEARGNRFELFINGQSVNSFTDMKIDGGGYGLYISKHAIGAFDNFEVKLEPAPLKQQDDVQRSESQHAGIKPLNIPRNPDRPLYPWEVGYDKDPKKKKHRLEREKEESETRPVDEPKKPEHKPAAKPKAATQPKKTTAKPTDELKRDAASRDADKGFVADATPEQEDPAPKEAKDGASLRDQYRHSKGEDAAPRKPLLKKEKPTEPAVEETTAPAVEEATEPTTDTAVDLETSSPEPSLDEPTPDSVELEDKTVTDTGKALPEADSATTTTKSSDDDVLYRRDPKFDDGAEKPAPTETKEDNPKSKKIASTKTPSDNSPDKSTKRKRGLNTSSDDWDSSARTIYEPKKRLPKTKTGEKPAQQPAPEPAEVVASDGSKVKVETLPLDGAPMTDSELEKASTEEASAPVSEPEADLPEPEPQATSEEETATSPFPSLDLPEVPSEPEPAVEKPSAEEAAPFSKPGEVTLSDDFTSQQKWNTQELPTSSYKYSDGGYAIDNLKAQTMAISYQQDKFSDVDIAVDAMHTGGADYVGYGVAARFTVGKDASGRTVISYYGMFISLSGEFMLLKVVDGQETVLKDWGLSPLVDLGVVNRIELRVDGSQITAIINGHEAATVNDTELTSGGYALLAGPGIGAHYDNLSLTGVRQ